MINRKQLAFMASLDFTMWPPEKTVETLAEIGYGAIDKKLLQNPL